MLRAAIFVTAGVRLQVNCVVLLQVDYVVLLQVHCVVCCDVTCCAIAKQGWLQLARRGVSEQPRKTAGNCASEPQSLQYTVHNSVAAITSEAEHRRH